MPDDMLKLTLHKIYQAQQRIAPYISRTPLLRSALLSAQLGCEVWLKLENRQHTGSFKPRGALHKILSLSSEERERGIVAASAGNHALGVAHAAQCLGLPKADLFVQANAAPAKIAKLRQYTVNLHFIGKLFDEAQAAAFEFAEKNGATYVSAYDDLDVIAGQGTVGLEIMQDLPDIDTIVVPVGGGGLIAGLATVAKTINPTIRVIGVNPAASPSAYLSKRDGYPYETYENEPTLAHGLAGGFGRVPFMVGMMLIDEIVLVSEDELMRGIAALIDSDQILLEASGVAGIAAMLAGKISDVRKCVCVLTGGNIDSDTLREVLGVNEYAAARRMKGVNGYTTNQRMNDVSGLAPDQRMASAAAQQQMHRSKEREKPGFIQTAYDEITYRLIGLAMEVHNELGPGHREEAYHNALVAKLKGTDLAFLDEPEIWVELEDGRDVQKYVPDLIVAEQVLTELKAQAWPMTRDDMAQVFDYFAGTECEVSLFLNFGRPRLEYHRLLPPQKITDGHARKSRRK